ncbi:TonB-dependent receptor [Phenylobacterium sp.]|uniref:TonB-dependent receptor n=1 Tax=Phenylobacterium sp. TaxID=1871053 RepID=UPI002F4206FD
MRIFRMLHGSASLAVLSALTCGATHAQDQTPTVDEIIVTAQKREQSLQDVPIVVTAVAGKLAQDAGVHDIKDLQILTPGLVVTSTSNETVTTARIRGVGTVGDNAGLESSVGVVIDGVYRPRNGVGFGDLGELERIEVLKGPQGTLFGKNATAGVINILSQAPQREFGANAELTVGNYGTVGGSASVTGPITDTLAGRLFFADRKRDGFYDVVAGQGPRARKDDADQDFYTVRGQLLLQPNDNVNIRFIADYTNRDESCCVAVQLNRAGTQGALDAVNPVPPSTLNPPDPFARVAYSNRPTDQQIEDGGGSLQADADLGWGRLTSITALRRWKSTNAQDADFSTADILYRQGGGPFSNRFDTVSQEIRLARQTERLDWLVGGFFASESLESTNQLLYGAQYEQYLGRLLSRSAANPNGIPNFVSVLTGRPVGTSYAAGQGTRDRYGQDTRTYALFTNEALHVTDRFDITGGLRYTYEKKDAEALQVNTDGGVGCGTALARSATIAGIVGPANAGTVLSTMCLYFENPGFNDRVLVQTHKDEKLSGTIKAAYRFSPQVMTYASFARGFKGGGFNLERAQAPTAANPLPITPTASTVFPAETADSYELGVKSTLLHRTLLLNATAFYQRYKNFQLNTFLGTTFVVTAIPKVTSQGVDADFVWFTPVHGLSAQGGLTYAVTEFGSTVPAGFAQLKDGRLAFAPLWSLSTAVTYEQPIGPLVARFNVSGKYMSGYNTGSDLNTLKYQNGYALVNARVGIGPQNQRWSVEAWASNLTNKDYRQVAFDATLQTGTVDMFLGQPRTYGMTLRLKY